MSATVAVVDYGMGNLRSVSQAVLHAAREASKVDKDIQVLITSDPSIVRRADRVVLPGQGAMRDCMRELHSAHADRAPDDVAPRSEVQDGELKRAVLEAAASKPLMGVCVGMQMLLDHSEEQDTPGLGLIPGRVRRFQLEGRLQADGSRFKVPQMGWNRVRQEPSDRDGLQGGSVHALWAGIPNDSWFYFVHSYYTVTDNPQHSAGTTDYGDRFTSALARDNIFATQFHPEKSAIQGLALFRNFLLWKP